MGFAVPDLVIESVIRDGIADLKANPTKIDDVFSELLEAYADRKYGAAEIARIKDFLSTKEIAVVHSFHEGAAKAPSYSIQLGSDNENKPHDAIDDFLEQQRETITVQAELDALKKVDPFTPDAYDSLTGKVSVDDAFDLSDVRTGHIFEDEAGTEHEIRSGISNETGNKFFFIAKGATVDLGTGVIRSFITEKQYEVKVAVDEVSIMVGIHTKEALLTKYLYTLLKYILRARKADLMTRCFDNPVIRGSDFTRDMEYQGDIVFTRFMTVSGRTEDTWKSDETPIIDSVDIDATAVDC